MFRGTRTHQAFLDSCHKVAALEDSSDSNRKGRCGQSINLCNNGDTPDGVVDRVLQLERLIDELLRRQSFDIDANVQTGGGKKSLCRSGRFSEEGSAMKLADFLSPAASLVVEAEVDQPHKRLTLEKDEASGHGYWRKCRTSLVSLGALGRNPPQGPKQSRIRDVVAHATSCEESVVGYGQ
jgi:hypothetical protein